MKLIESKKIERVRLLFNPLDENDSKSAMGYLMNKFGENRFLYSVGKTNNPNESVITAEGV